MRSTSPRLQPVQEFARCGLGPVEVSGRLHDRERSGAGKMLQDRVRLVAGPVLFGLPAPGETRIDLRKQFGELADLALHAAIKACEIASSTPMQREKRSYTPG